MQNVEKTIKITNNKQKGNALMRNIQQKSVFCFLHLTKTVV